MSCKRPKATTLKGIICQKISSSGSITTFDGMMLMPYWSTGPSDKAMEKSPSASRRWPRPLDKSSAPQKGAMLTVTWSRGKHQKRARRTMIEARHRGMNDCKGAAAFVVRLSRHILKPLEMRSK